MTYCFLVSNRKSYIAILTIISYMESKEEIHELSKILNMPKEEIEKLLEQISKPSLDNSHCTFDNELGVGNSDKPT